MHTYIWCWTCIIELSGTCISVILKLNIFILLSIAWFCPEIASLSATSKATVFLITTLKSFQRMFFEHSVLIKENELFCQILDFHLLAISLFFSSVMSLLYWDLSAMIFKWRVYETDSDAWPKRSLVCWVNVTNVSRGTFTASENSFRTFSNPFQSCDNGSIICKIFAKSIPNDDQSR